MADVGIFRVAKLKSMTAIVGLTKHHTREHDPSNARKELSSRNEINPSWLVGERPDLPATAMEVKERWKQITQDVNIRSNAVLALDLLVTVPSEDMNRKSPEEIRAFLSDGYRWIVEKHGAENVMLATVHHDELGPHLHVMVAPMKEGKLNARDFYGGSRFKMREVQDDFYDKVSRHHGLERGTLRERTTWRESADFAHDLREAPHRLMSKNLQAGIPQEAEAAIYVYEKSAAIKPLASANGYDTENPMITAFLAGQMEILNRFAKELSNDPSFAQAIQLHNLKRDRHRPVETEKNREYSTQKKDEELRRSSQDRKIDPGTPGIGIGM